MKSLFKENIFCSTAIDWRGKISSKKVLDLADDLAAEYVMRPKVWLASDHSHGNIRGENKIRQQAANADSIYELTIRNYHSEDKNFWDFSLLFFDCELSKNANDLSVLQVAINADRHDVDFEAFARKIQQFVDNFAGFTYGYAFESAYENNIENYGPGMALGGIYDEKNEDNSRWYYNLLSAPDQQAPNRQRHGKQRFPYPLNYLSDRHVNFDLGGSTLAEWIGSSNGSYGRLEKIGSNLWQWSLNEKQSFNVISNGSSREIFLSLD